MTLVLPDAALRVLGAARCDLRQQDGAVELSEGAGEVRYLLREERGGFRLIRYDRGDPALWEISADALDDVARYLMVELAPVARAFHELRPVAFPTFDPAVAPGFTRDETADAVIVRQGGRIRAGFRPEDPSGISRSRDFTWYADVPLEEIADLVLTVHVPAGAEQ